ncbi:hypothetical protein [Streptomyces sp. NPDC058657]|uniref:hypothetical protein n=1 Tax=unclassified Streptomyces TaxID=2593676 RepID=UPI003646FE2F
MALGALSRDQLVELVRRIVAFGGNEEEVDAMEQLFEESVPYPGAYSLIYRHDPDLTPEEVVDIALSCEAVVSPYRPDPF